MSLKDFKMHEKAFKSLNDEEISRPTMPVPDAVQMAENLFVWSQADVKELSKAGLDTSLINELPTRAGALRYIEAQWKSDKNMRTDAAKEWKKVSPIGYELQAEMEHHFRFAFYGNSDLLNRVNDIAKNAGHADMIQDLMDYAALGKANIDLLKASGFAIAKLTEAENLANKLGELLALSNNDREEGNQLKEQRDQAFTFLYDAIREIHRVGQFVFWRTPERKKGYVNSYH